MASVKALKNKEGIITSYRITVSLGYDHGTKILKSTTYRPKKTDPEKAKKEAYNYAAVWEQAVKDNKAGLRGEKMRFDDFVKEWADKDLTIKVNGGKITQRTKEDYVKIMSIHISPIIGKTRLTKISLDDIENIVLDLQNKGKSANTIRNIFNTLKSCLQYAKNKRYISENPCMSFTGLPDSNNIDDVSTHIFNADQVKRFLSEALTKEYNVNIGGRNHNTEKRPISLQHRVYFTLALYSGCRRGELIGLNWCDIDSIERKISINKAVSRSDEKGLYLKDPKTKSGKRIIYLPGECFELLSLWRKEQQHICDILGSAWVGYRGEDYDKNPVFIQTDSGKRMHVETPSHKFKQILEAYNNSVSEDKQLPMIRLHDLRHTNISHLIGNNIDPETIKALAGHSDFKMDLNVYGHPLEENKKKAATILSEKFKLAQ